MADLTVLKIMNASRQDRHMSPQPDLHMHLQNRESSSGFPHLRLMVFSLP